MGNDCSYNIALCYLVLSKIIDRASRACVHKITRAKKAHGKTKKREYKEKRPSRASPQKRINNYQTVNDIEQLRYEGF